MQFNLRRLTPAYILASLLALVGAVLLARSGLYTQAEVIKKAAGIDKENVEGLEEFIKTCEELTTPAVLAAAAATPLAVIGGGVAMAFGSRRGLSIIITAFAVLILLGSLDGILK